MRMKSQLSLIISFQVETSLTIVLFLLLSSYYYTTVISAEQGGEIQLVMFSQTCWTAEVHLLESDACLYFSSFSGFACFSSISYTR